MPERRVCTRCGKNRALKFYKTPRGRVCTFCQKDRVRGASREVRLAELYGLTLEDYDKLLQAQGGACAICGGARRYNLHIDHDHTYERWALTNCASDTAGDAQASARASVRGLLCKRCNKLLAMVRDNPELLFAAIEYLRNPPASHVLCLTPQ